MSILQKILTFLGYLITDKATFFGDSTEGAVKAWQAANQKKATGKVTRAVYLRFVTEFIKAILKLFNAGAGKNYFVFGRVVNEESLLGVSGLKVEAWDKDWIFKDDPLGEVFSEEGGWFRLEFNSKEAQEWIFDRKPDLFFRVYRGDELVGDTSNSIKYNVGHPEVELIIPVSVDSGVQQPDPMPDYLGSVISKFPKADQPWFEILLDDIVKFGKLEPVEQLAALTIPEVSQIIDSFSTQSNFFKALANDILTKAKIIWQQGEKSPELSIQVEHIHIASFQAKITGNQETYDKAIIELDNRIKNQELWKGLADSYSEILSRVLRALLRQLRRQSETDDFIVYFKRVKAGALINVLAGFGANHPFVTTLSSTLAPCLAAAAAENTKNYGFIVQVVNTAGQEKKGIPGLRVQTQLLYPDANDPLDLGVNFTNNKGFFGVDYGILSSEPQAAYPFVFTVFNEKGNLEFLKRRVSVPIDSEAAIPLKLKFEKESARKDVQLKNLPNFSSYPKKLRAYLADKGIANVTQLAALGGLKNMEGLPIDPGSAFVAKLEGHVNLGLFSADVNTNELLINKGYTNLKQIGGTPREVFIKEVGNEIGAFRAFVFQAGMRHSEQYLNNVVTQLVVNKKGQGLPIDVGANIPEKNCTCEDCNSAVSPLAYLAELLDYVLDNVRNDGNKLTSEALKNLFHQPFGELPVACSLMEEKICQIRLAIEVLWKEYEQRSIPQSSTEALEKAGEAYTSLTYRMLLEQFGTSYEAIRLIRHPRPNESTEAYEERRKALAGRIGIDLIVDLDGTSIGTLDALFKDASTTISELELEQLFGFRDTRRDPLSGTPGSSIEKWRRAHLRTLWQTQDWTDDEYSRGELPVIDPDIVGIDDFRHPVAGQLVFDTWEKRRHWVDAIIAEFSGITQVRGIYPAAQVIQVPGVNLSADLLPDDTFEISGSAGNNGRYTVISVKFEEGASFLAVKEPIPDTTADGGLSFDKIRRIFSLDPTTRMIVIANDDLTSDLQEGDEIGIQNSTGNNGNYTINEIAKAGNNTEIFLNETFADPTPDGEVWIRRFIPIGGDIIPDLDALLARMYQAFEYDGESIAQAWKPAIPSGQLETKDHQLESKAASQVQAVIDEIKENLSLEIDAFKRLIAIRIKDKEHANAPQAEPVSKEEWREVYNILAQAVKYNFHQAWSNEENGKGLYLGPNDFWAALKEPAQGAWPPGLSPEIPLIDPEAFDLKDLPEPTAGKMAIQFYNDRLKHQEQDYQALKTARETDGFDKMIKIALGNPDPGDPLPHKLEDLEAGLSNADADIVLAAEHKIEQDLYLSVEVFKRMMAIHAKQSTDIKPTQEEWREVYAMLTSAQKRKRRYPAWISDEQKVNLAFWQAYKAKLPKWRASFKTREKWKNGLENRSAAPIVDPNLLFPIDFDPSFQSRNLAFQLWNDRRLAVDQFIAGLKAVGTDLASFEAIVSNTIGVSMVILYDLSGHSAKGEDIRSRLAQLNLSLDTFDKILVIWALAQNEETILESEWEEIYHILARVWKERHFRTWQIEEEKAGLTHSQDFFKMPDPPLSPFPIPEPLITPRWLTGPSERISWQRTLEGRIEQEETTREAIQNALGDVEEIVLIGLRDALIKAIGKSSRSLSGHLLIDTENNGCQKTTRISQAIESLQSLLWSIHTGLLEDSYPNLSLVATSFEEEWQWIGSYATWRAARFVFIYPENILLPSLRKWQSPAFRTLVDDMRSNRRLNPDQACEYAKEYASYFKEICNLSIAATAKAYTRITPPECRKNHIQDIVCLFYKFALSDTRKAYWSVYNPKNPTGYGYADTYWEAIPGLEDNIIEIVGTPVYKYTEAERNIYLLLKYKEGKEIKLGYTKYNLEARSWDGSLEELEVPKKALEFSAVAIQSYREAAPPQLAIKVLEAEEAVYKGAFFKRNFNEKGEDWEEGEWDDFLIIPALKGKDLQLHAAIEINTAEYVLFCRNAQLEEIQYRVFGHFDDGIFRDATTRSFIGATFWKGSQDCFLISRNATSDNTYCQKITRSNTIEYSWRLSTIDGFNDWMKEAFGLSFDVPNLYGFRGFGFSLGSDPTLLDYLRFFEDNLYNFDQPYVIGSDFRNEVINLINYVAGPDSELHEKIPDWKYLTERFPNYEEEGSPLSKVLDVILFKQGSIKVKKRSASNEVASEGSIWGSTLKIAKDFGAELASGKSPIIQKHIAHHLKNSPKVIWRNGLKRNGALLSLIGSHRQLTPDVYNYYEIPEQLSENDLPIRRSAIASLFERNAGAPSVVWDYLKEAFFFVPMHLGLQLQFRSHYISALNYYRTIYNYVDPSPAGRKIYYGLVEEESLDIGFSRAGNWMLDPLNPHAIADSRAGVYTRFTIQTIVRCLLEYGDSEFSFDTAESVPRAKELYTTALELLDLLKPQEGECEALLGTLDVNISDGEWQQVWEEVKDQVPGNSEIISVISTIIQNDQLEYEERMELIEEKLLAWQENHPPMSIREVLQENDQMVNQVFQLLASDEQVRHAVMNVYEFAQQEYSWKMQSVTGQDVFSLVKGKGCSISNKVITDIRAKDPLNPSYAAMISEIAGENKEQAVELTGTVRTEYVPRPFLVRFCVPRNPVIEALGLKAELNLFKIRNGLNIAGIEREIDPYAAPTDTISGLPTIGAGGNLILPGTVNLPPTPYRFKVLIERAKQLVSIAQQVESAFLAAIEKYDHESYNLLKARQDLELAKAGISLQDLRLKEAKDGVKLSELQLQRSELQVQELQNMIDAGLNDAEIVMITSYIISGVAQVLSAIANAVIEVSRLSTIASTSQVERSAESAANAASGLGWLITKAASDGVAVVANTTAQVASVYASLERRKQEWEYQKTLANQDIKVGNQQVKLSEDRVQIVGQEREIARMQQENAEETMTFLRNKFTNSELYDWVSNVLEGVYSFFLQQATSTAIQAANQLAFERQELPPPFIQADYWEPPTGQAQNTLSGGSEPDRRGLTGSARLLQDIHQLDQYAFDTDSRKQQLTKNISLANYAPIAFQMFKDTGLMTFATPMEIFDRDFPGHYLRLIKRVKVSVIALIPPTEGIKATLTNIGLSRAVIGGDIFQNVQVRRSPETVSLSSPRESTGMFELHQDSEFLNPFESQGVDTFWEFRMEKASNFFDYRSIADVLITIEYTALSSFDYRRQVIQNLGSDVSLNRPFSIKNQFADQWYDLHNPEYTDTPMSVRFIVSQNDFPPNISELAIQQVALFFSFNDQEKVVPIEVALNFKEEGSSAVLGGGGITDNGLASTLQGNAGSWIAMIGKLPYGEWELSLPDNFQSRRLFQEELVNDILLVISYNGFTSNWIS